MYHKFITIDQYQDLGGQNKLSEQELQKYNVMFASLIRTNLFMLSPFYKEYGDYPLEIKMAMVEYIDFQIAKAQVDPNISSSSVGSTSVSYNDHNDAKYYGDLRFQIPIAVKQILLPTNILTPYPSSKRQPLLATPYHPVSPLKEQDNVPLHNASSLIESMPHIEVTLYKELVDGKNVNEDEIEVRPTSKYQELGTVKGWVKDTFFTDDHFAWFIIEPYLPDGSPIDLNRSDLVTYEIDGIKFKRVVQKVNREISHNGKTHHLAVFVE
jgi:hypothetical protein